MAERVTLEEAAQRMGISVRTARRRVRAGTLPAEREETPQGFRYFVILDSEDSEPGPDPESVASAAEPTIVTELRDERDWLRGRVEALEQTVERLTKQAENYQVLIGQAQRLAELPAAGQAGHEPDSQGVVDDQPAGSQRTGRTSGTPAEAAERPATAPKSRRWWLKWLGR